MLDKLVTELKLRGFSERTVKAYVTHNQKFLEFIKKDAQFIIEDDIKSYLAYLLSDRKVSPKTAALVKAALKFYYDEVLKKGIVNLKTPKTEKHLPTVLTKGEVKRLIESAKTAKSKLIVFAFIGKGQYINLTVLLEGELEL